MALADKARKTLETKNELRYKMTEKGASISTDDKFSIYPDKLDEISSGSKAEVSEASVKLTTSASAGSTWTRSKEYTIADASVTKS